MSTDDVARFWAKVRVAANGCWEWTANRAGGSGRRMYGQFTYTIDKQQHHEGAHRLAWEIAHDQLIPVGQLACHTCENGLCVRADHIYIGTQFDNMRDASRSGALSRPRKRNRATVEAVRRLWLAGGVSQAELAALYGVAPTQITR